MSLKETLTLSIIARNGVPAGRTWGDFQVAMTRMGIKWDTPLASIEYGISATGRGSIRRDDDDHGRVEIRELS